MITGGGSGIGRAAALHLASCGAAIGVVDIGKRAAEAVAEDISKEGGMAASYECDVRYSEQIQDVLGKIEKSFGPLTAQVNCAGVYKTQRFLDVTEANWDFIMDVNAKGLFFCVQAAARSMIERRRGAIINMSSVAGRSGRPLNVHYAASKAAVINITRSAAKAFGPYNIRVNALCPGVIDTPMWQEVVRTKKDLQGREGVEGILESIPLHRIGSPEEVASLIAYLISRAGAYVNGQAINICGGFEMD